MKLYLFITILLVLLNHSVNGKIRTTQAFVGQNADLKCELEGIVGNAGIEYRWEKPTGNVLSNSRNLKLTQVTRNMGGIYACYATYMANGEKKEMYTGTNLLLKDPDTLEFIKEPVILFNDKDTDILKAKERAYLYVTCNVLNWNNNDYKAYFETKENHGVNNNILFIFPLKKDTRAKCVAKHKRTGQVLTRSLSIIINRTPAKQNGRNSRLMITTNPIAPFHNKQYEMNCELSPPIPGARFEWTRNGRVVTSRQRYVIQNFQKENIGSYICSVVLPRGYTIPNNRFEKRVQYRKTVDTKVSLTETGTQLVANVGDEREMHCEIQQSDIGRYQGSNVEWFYEGQLITNYMMNQNNLERQNRIYVSILRFKRISLSNEGQYECRYGSYVGKGVLVVMQKQAQVTIEPPLLEISENQPAEFHCQLYNLPGSYPQQVTWSYRPSSEAQSYGARSVGDIQSMGYVIEVQSSNTVFITKTITTAKDSGFYTCNLPNGMSQTGELRIKRIFRPPAAIRVTPKETVTKPNNPVYIECSSTMNGRNSGNLGFRIRGNLSPLTDPRFRITALGSGRMQLIITPGLSVRESGMEIECYSSDSPGTDIARIIVRDACSPGQRKCRSGECMDDSKFCDGYRDCLDGSDEDKTVCNQCKPLIKTCEYYNGVMPKKKTYLAHWKCDGENDCGNNFDESNCDYEAKRCSKHMYQCRDGRSIPRSFQCDKERDCPGNEDETNCVASSFIRDFRPQTQSVMIGTTLVLTCTAVGTPLPTIIWRYNWGCLKDNTRMREISISSQDCAQQTSTLTITNYQPEDSGIYNCEALAGDTRVFSEDYRIMTKPRLIV